MATSLSMAVADLSDMIKSLRVPCIDERGSFVPQEALRQYLTNRQDRVLRRLLEEFSVDPSRVDTIRENYLFVFVILIQIGEGAKISEFSRLELPRDGRLPFPDGDKQYWPESYHVFFPQFCKEQRQFCVRVWNKRWLNGRVLDDEELLPILKQETIRNGSNSVISEIELFPDHNGFGTSVCVF
jgi:hypothetical protein